MREGTLSHKKFPSNIGDRARNVYMYPVIPSIYKKHKIVSEICVWIKKGNSLVSVEKER